MPLNFTQPQFTYEAPEGGTGGAPEGEGGGEDSGVSKDGFYDLSEVAPELRPEVEKHLKAIEGRVTPRLQEAAELRKQWEPYQELGVNEMDPDELSGLINFAQLLSEAANGNDEALERFGEWYERIGGELELGGDEEFSDGEDYDSDEDRIAEQITKAVEPLYQKMAETEQNQMVQEQLVEIQKQTADLQKEHGLSEEDVDVVLRFAATYEDEDDPISKGFEDYQRLVNKGEGKLFADKASGGKSPEGEGPADTAPRSITTFDEAKKAAAERLAQSMAT